MKQTNEPMSERADNDILFSKTVKAGKRVYYIDVKRDRRDAYYMSITESKRVKEGNADERPVFEKHKIFLYREDMEKFMDALTSAIDFAVKNGPIPDFSAHSQKENGWEGAESCLSQIEREDGDDDHITDGGSVTEGLSDGKIKLDIDF